MRPIKRRIRRRRDGSITVELPAAERELLRHLADDLAEMLAADEPDGALIRLFPTAYADDADADAEFQRLMHDDLSERHRWALATLAETADATSLDAEQAAAWMRAANQVRLVLGTSLDVGEEPIDVDPDDPDAGRWGLYGYLSWLVDQLVDALSG